MASNKRTIHLGLDYTQFTGGITEVNRKMGLLDAEFKLAQEQAKNYGTATDELGLKQEYLTQKIALQNQKVEEAKRAYEAAATSQNASQKEIDNLQKKFLQESTTLEKLNGQLKINDETIKQTDKDTKSFGDEIRGLANTLGINVSPAVEKLKQIRRRERFGRQCSARDRGNGRRISLLHDGSGRDRRRTAHFIEDNGNHDR